MKKKIFLLFGVLLSSYLFSETKIITIDNVKHKYEDSFIVNNQTSEIISLDIFIKRKENTAENKVGSGIIEPNKRSQIKTSVDDDFDDYDYIIVKTIGDIKEYKVECKNDDIIFTILSYEGIETAIGNTVQDLKNQAGALYENEINIVNEKNLWRDYIKVYNKTGSYVNCSVFGKLKNSDNEIHIGTGAIDPNGDTKINTIYDKKLNELASIRFTSDAIILDYETNSSSHDCNIIIYACEGGKSPITTESENDYNKEDVVVKIGGNYKREDRGLAFYNFNVLVQNNTGRIIKVKFEESSITYNGKTSVPFIEGQKYLDAGNPPPNKIIPNGTTSEFSMYAANQVSWEYSNWHVSSMGDNVTVILAVEIESKTYYWVTYAKIRN